MIPAKVVDNKGTQILAKTLYKELRANGYSLQQILGLSTELIELVTGDIKAGSEAHAQAAQEAEAVPLRAAV